MKLSINLPFRNYIRAVEEPILLPEQEVKMAFTSKEYAPFDYLKVFINHNGRLYAHNVAFDQEIDLTPILKAGVLEINVKAVVKSEVVKSWEIVPIIVKEVTPDFVLTDLLKEYEERISALEEQHKPIL